MKRHGIIIRPSTNLGAADTFSTAGGHVNDTGARGSEFTLQTHLNHPT